MMRCSLACLVLGLSLAVLSGCNSSATTSKPAASGTAGPAGGDGQPKKMGSATLSAPPPSK